MKKTLPRAEASQYAAWFRALADPTRIQIVSLLARAAGQLTVGEIVGATDVSQATVSQHLKVLAGIRFVVAERRGTAHYYRLNDVCVAGFPTAADLVMGREPPARDGDGGAPRGREPAAAGDNPVAARKDPAAARHEPAAAADKPVAARKDPAAARHEPAVPRDDRPAGGSPAGVIIRPMTSADATQVLAIYQAGLDDGEASFETRAPTWEAFDAKLLPAHRHVAADGTSGQVLGWVAASGVSDRCVYQGVVEHSVYVAAAARHRGLGAVLLRTLIGSTEAAGIWTIQSGIFPENTASLRLHERAGFRAVGVRARLGRHRGRWRDVVLLERRSARAGVD
jgi:L-amino acid N-acyltransferase YncA/DNA-binding transcriptional ArsR family regulator